MTLKVAGSDSPNPTADRFARLKPGPKCDGVDVGGHQRTRLQRAMTELVAGGGYRSVTIRKLTKLAGVSTQAFYGHFGSKEECIQEAYDQAVRGAARIVVAAARTEVDWEARLRVSLRAYMEAIARHPRSARLVLLEAFASGFPARRRMRHTFGLAEAIVHDGFGHADGSTSTEPMIVKGVVGGLITVTRARLLEGREHELPDLAEELADWACLFGRVDVDLSALPGPDRSENRLEDENAWQDLQAQLASDDRGLLLAAVRELAATGRLADLSARQIRIAAGVSRRGFERAFDDADGCLLAAVDQAIDSATTLMREAYFASSDWAGGVCRMFSALCDRLARDPSLTRLGFTEALCLGPAAVRQRVLRVNEVAESLRASAPSEARPSALVGEASIGGIWTILEHQAAAAGPMSLRRCAPTIALLALAPAIGADAAAARVRAEVRTLSPA